MTPASRKHAYSTLSSRPPNLELRDLCSEPGDPLPGDEPLSASSCSATVASGLGVSSCCCMQSRQRASWGVDAHQVPSSWHSDEGERT